MNAGSFLAGPEVQAILPPVLAMLLLTFLVWIAVFATRFRAFGQEKVDPAQLNTPEAVTAALPLYARNPANNFKNLFEVPVVFYVLCFYLYVTGTADNIHVTSAWVFVGFRYIHSAIHCSYNNVGHRFLIYAIACLALWVMLIRALLEAAGL